MNFCLPQSLANKFIKGLQSGEIDTDKLATMESEDRHAFLAKYVGEENAKNVNALFESKMLLKDQQLGYMNWIKQTVGLNSPVGRDLVSKVERMERILNPKEAEAFKRDLASTRLGADVTQEEAKHIFDLSQKVKETKALQQEDLTFKTEDERLAYGNAKVAFGNYVNELKNRGNEIGLHPTSIIKNLPGISKSIRASMDNSAIFRQGWKTLMTNPLLWQRNAKKSFVDIVREFGGKKVMDEITADIVSRPTYELMQKAKLATATIEEAYPSSLPEKIPVLGRAYKASETAYTGFLHRMRADVFDKYIDIAKKSGVELTDKELRSIGSMVNSLTGRGNFGKYEGSAVNAVNNVFFSPRNLKAQIDTLGHVITGAGGSNFVRKQAAYNLVKIVMGTAAVLTVADAVKPGSVEKDPRSADFGKIKIGDTRFDVTGGMSSIITLAARLATMSSKSSTTGKITPLNARSKKGVPLYGAPTGLSVIENFFENKLSPVASVVKDLMKGQDFQGKKPTLQGEAENLFVPLSVSTFKELQQNPNAANILVAMIADALGIATNTYSAKKK